MSDIQELDIIGVDNRICTLVERPQGHMIGIVGNWLREPTGRVLAAVDPSDEKPYLWQTKQNLSKAKPITYASDELKEGCRQVAISGFNQEKSYQLFLEMADDYRIPLHYAADITAAPIGALCAETTEKSEESPLGQHMSWLAPILPRMYSDRFLDLDNGVTLPSAGFVYIFYQGHLWRELEIIKQQGDDTYQLAEINLEKDFGLSQRMTRIALNDDAILVPVIINGQEQGSSLRIAYSMVQWSWRQIAAYGGLHKDDPRIGEHVQKDVDAAQVQQLQENRLQKLGTLLPWQGEDKWTKQSWLVSEKANKQHSDEKHNKLPQVVLYNPLGIAYQHMGDCLSALKELNDAYTELADTSPHHAAGEMLHRLLYNPKLDAKRRNEQILRSVGGKIVTPSHIYDHNDDTAVYLRKIKSEDLDEAKLHNYLFPQDITQKIRKLDAAKLIHFDWLNEKLHDNDSGNLINSYSKLISPVRLHAILADLANLDPSASELQHNPLFLQEMWLSLIAPLHAKKSTVNDRYSYIGQRSDSGVDWVNMVIDSPEHPIHKMLFASKQQMDATVSYDDDNPIPDTVKFDGSGTFIPSDLLLATQSLIGEAKGDELASSPSPKAQDFDAITANNDDNAQAAHSSSAAELMSKTQKEIALGQRIVSDFFAWINQAVSNPQDLRKGQEQTIKTFRRNLFINMAQALQLDDLRGMKLVLANTAFDSSKYVVLAANDVRMQQLDKTADRQFKIDALTKDASGKLPDVLLESADGQHVGSSNLAQNLAQDPRVRALPYGERLDPLSFYESSATQGRTTAFVTVAVDVVVVDKNAPWYKKPQIDLGMADQNLSHSSVSLSSKTTIVGARGAAAGLGFLMMYYELMTLNSIILNDSLKDKPWQQNYIAKFVAGVSAVATAGDTTTASATLIGKHKLASALKTWSMGKFTFDNKLVDLTVFKTLGTGVAVVTSVMAGIDAYQSFNRQDHDAGAAMGASALVGGTVAAIGAAELLGLISSTAVAGPVVWCLIGATIGLAILAEQLRDKPLQDWVKHGPFGQHSFTGDYAAWQNQPDDCYQALLSQLFSPKISLSQELDKQNGQQAMVAKVELPFFTPKIDQLLLHTTCASVYLDTIDTIVTPIGDIIEDPFTLTKRERPQQVMQPYRVEPIYKQGTEQLQSLTHFYEIPASDKDSPEHNWRSRMQLQSGNMRLPSAYKPDLYADLPAITDAIAADKQVNWLHAQIKVST